MVYICMYTIYIHIDFYYSPSQKIGFDIVFGKK